MMASLGSALVVCVWMTHTLGTRMNIALNKPAKMSSTRAETLPPGGAVDGKITTVYRQVIHTVTGHSSAWWTVDLEKEVRNVTVKIYFRTDHTNRRNGVQFYTSTAPFSNINLAELCYSVSGRPDGSDINSTVSDICPGPLRYLTVYTQTDNDGNGAVLDFGEVEVWDCSSGLYGQNCSKSCSSRQCANTSSDCDDSGTCVGGCMAGWNGTDCTMECPSGTYGDACVKMCSRRHCVASSDTCDHVNGTCPRGCMDGWNGTDCIHECPSGTYGDACVKLCRGRHCATPSDICDHVSGTCPGGCMDGWNGTDCTHECPSGTYGDACVKMCSRRHCVASSDTCDHVNGTCPRGCMDGWNGTDCTHECPSGTYGDACEKLCSSRPCATPSDICDHVSGTCPGGCMDGWTGADCTYACEDCSDACNVTTGHCPLGCEDIYQGERCQTFPLNPKVSVVPAVVGTVAGLLVIVVIIIIVFVYRRRKRSSPKDDKQHSDHALGDINDDKVSVILTMERDGSRSHETRNLKAVSVIVPDPQPEEETDDEEGPCASSEYYNISYVEDVEDATGAVPVENLEDVVQRIKHSGGGFEAEYNRLPTDIKASHDEARKPENSGKNRFRGYYPYDYNRVHLSLRPDIPGSDYINASFMLSYDKSKTYIAAQAPNKSTVGDFWRMIWEHRCSRVVMLTSLVEGTKAKCYQYWLTDGILDMGDFRVEVEVTDTRANYTVRRIIVICKQNEDSRSVLQYHFTTWPDHGVPDTLALVNFMWMIRGSESQTGEPLLVHCSAGIGRTGTYIAVDSLLDQALGMGIVDVHGYVAIMRGQRKNMIQTKEQYECVFKCLVEMTKFGNTSMDVETFTISYSNSGMESIVDQKTIMKLTQMVTNEDRNDPVSRHQMWVDGNQDFIIRVGPTLRHLHGYIQVVTHSPELEKLLWKLVEENNVHNIIVMSPIQVDIIGETGLTRTHGDISLKTSQTSGTTDFNMATIHILKTKNMVRSRTVKLYQLTDSPTTDSISSLLLEHPHLQNLSAENTPVVIIHSESDRKCAVSLSIMGNILSGIMEDHRVDVIGHARAFLKCCPDLTFSEQDIVNFHHFAQKYIKITGIATIYAKE